jgi:HK97 family phage prohead protease
MPNPNNYDNREDYMKACVPIVIGEGLTDEQAVGKCEGMWDNKGKETKPETKSTGKKLRYKAMLIAEPPKELIKNRIKASGLEIGLTEVKSEISDPGASQTPSEGSENTDEHIVWAIVSTESVDSDSEVILMNGLNTSEYEKNPLFYYNHEHTADYNIGKCIGLYKNENHMIAKFQFDQTEGSLGDKLYKLYAEGRMNQFSIGFEVNEESSKPSYCHKFGENCKNVITKCTLFEISAVDMGANTDTKVLEVKEKADTSYDIPYLGGCSNNGKVYIDKDLPNELTVGDKTFNPHKYIKIHEETEFTLMHNDNPMTYEEAHVKATQAEKDAVEQDGIDWEEYSKAISKYIKIDENKKDMDLPDDLDEKPYEDEGDTEEVKKIESNVKEKEVKIITKSYIIYTPSKRELMSKGRTRI